MGVQFSATVRRCRSQTNDGWKQG